MEDYLLLIVVIKGGNIMGNPLLRATGVAIVGGESTLIEKETPITSIPDFLEAFEGLFKEENSEEIPT
uniref:Uncharacterized protein n=1 Tax=viral metagenome TaxID=1070528 RepID=A0A6H1Z7Z9_9ZZZZ